MALTALGSWLAAPLRDQPGEAVDTGQQGAAAWAPGNPWIRQVKPSPLWTSGHVRQHISLPLRPRDANLLLLRAETT